MKVLRAFLVVVVLAVPCLCLAEDTPTFPSLVGEWQGRAQYHSKLHGHVTPEPGVYTPLTIATQEGGVFSGYLSWNDAHVGQDDFSGVFDMDGQTFYTAGHVSGIRIGKMQGPDTFILYFLIPGTENPCAGFVTYTRVE
ncbi:MAG: hypothetical protein D6E12_14325 [Desulfovibrio sp.]|nr:MAG: hypothetical protein D6E12_14325 [Desulfovibrio sp.]